MITLKTAGYKPEDYKFIELVFRVGMDKIFSEHCLEVDCDACRYKRACGDIIRLLEYCQKKTIDSYSVSCYTNNSSIAIRTTINT